jgi:hypothetical protein
MSISLISEATGREYSLFNRSSSVLVAWLKQLSSSFSNKLRDELKAQGINVSNQDEFLKALLQKVSGNTPVSDQKLSQIKARFFEFKGKVTGLKDLMVLAYLAANGPKSMSVAQMLELNDEPNQANKTQLADLVKMAKDSGANLKEFCKTFVEEATKFAEAEKKSFKVTLSPEIITAAPAPRNLYDSYLLNHLKISISYESPVQKVLDEKRKFEDQLKKLGEKKLTEKQAAARDNSRRKIAQHKQLKDTELKGLAQQKDNINPFDYTQRRQEILNSILRKDQVLQNIVA